MRVMVTGGAGYIGAHVVRLLQQRGDDVLVVDDLSSGRPDRVSAPVARLDLASDDVVPAIVELLDEHRTEAVIHLAARKDVGESVARPLWYYEQNVTGLAHLLRAVRRAGVGRVVLSSSAAVYGSVEGARVAESAPTVPVNPYGRTKLAGEWLLRDAARADGLRAVSLRYFNVAGAGWPDLGDPGVANLVTIAIDRWTRGLPVQVHGTAYPTSDGSCVRDYVHVADLAAAHLSALDHLEGTAPTPDALNIGTGRGFSVLEMLDALAAASGGRAGRVEHGPRRPGDPAQVVADPAVARRTLGWTASADLGQIARSAWEATPPR